MMPARGRVSRHAGPRAARGLTMVEILVTLGIIVIVIGSVLSVFVAGARFGLRAQERTEAGRVALAVFDLANKGFVAGAARGRGASGDGKFIDGEVVASNILSTMTDVRIDWASAYVADTPLELVWKYEISAYPADGIDMHTLKITVCFDENGDMEFDDPPEDRLIGRYSAILADRGP